MARCTCRYETVNSATIDPPDLIRDKWCPLHGRDPDEERERQRDDAAYDRAAGWDRDADDGY